MMNRHEEVTRMMDGKLSCEHLQSDKAVTGAPGTTPPARAQIYITGGHTCIYTCTNILPI